MFCNHKVRHLLQALEGLQTDAVNNVSFAESRAVSFTQIRLNICDSTEDKLEFIKQASEQLAYQIEQFGDGKATHTAYKQLYQAALGELVEKKIQLQKAAATPAWVECQLSTELTEFGRQIKDDLDIKKEYNVSLS